MGEILCSCSMC